MSIGTGEPDPDDPAEPGVEDELQELVGRVSDRRPGRDSGQHRDLDEEELDFSCGGKLPPDHPDADLFDDLDL